MTQRRRLRQATPLKERLTTFAEQAREQADRLPAGAERDAQLKRARLADTAAHIDDWVSSPGLRRSK